MNLHYNFESFLKYSVINSFIITFQRYPYNLFIQRYRILGLKELQRIPSYQKSSSCEILVHAVANQIINDSENSNDKSEIVENKTRNKR